MVPQTSLGSRSLIPGELGKTIYWHPAPKEGHAIDFALYFVEDDHRFIYDDSRMTVVASTELDRLGGLVVTAEEGPMIEGFRSTIEQLIRDSEFTVYGEDGSFSGSHLWFTTGEDELRLPLIVDLPPSVSYE